MTDLTELQEYIDANYPNLAGADHFSSWYGITTPAQLDEYLDYECFVNVYKDDHGFKPRGYTIEQARDYLNRGES